MKKSEPNKDEQSREERIKEHQEFQKKISEMFARTGIQEIKNETIDNSYTISFQNNNTNKEKDK
jgi:hypothetical protein